MNGSVLTMVIVGGYVLGLFLSIYVCCFVLITKFLVRFTKKEKGGKKKNTRMIDWLVCYKM